MTDKPRICVDRILSPEKQLEAARIALEENPSNMPGPIRFSPGLGVAATPSPMALAALTGTKWRVGRTIKVKFLGGEAAIQDKVVRYAKLWEQHANLNLDFGNHADADVRIAFELGQGSWSWVGTEAAAISRQDPTMNFGWLTASTPDSEYERVVCHEFGHALGCIHEHQHPEAGIPWDRESVYAFYAGPPNNWSRAMVDNNLFRRYERDQTQFSAFDKQSIMLYAIPNSLTVGDFEVGWNRALSPVDKQFIGVVYPRQQRASVELRIGGPAIKAEIGEHGEENVFTFRVTSPGQYAVSTAGRTDVVLSIFGPDSETRLVAQDDDSGSGLNALVRRWLVPGTFYVRIRHYRPRGKGQYEVSVKRAGGSQGGPS